MGDIDQSSFHPTMQHGQGSVVVWGYMTWDDSGFLASTESTMITALYMNILAEDPWETVKL
ncbi:hypothetical protein BGZ46_004689, partial [Entomortierella lignicola]